MGVAPGGGGGAAGEGAVPVAEPEGFGLGGGEVPQASSPVQDVPVGGQDDGDDGAVAGQPADGLGAEEGAGVDAADQDAGSGPVLQVVQADGDDHGGLGPGRCDGRRGGHGAAADLDEGVAAALVDGAGVGVPRRPRSASDRTLMAASTTARAAIRNGAK